MQSVDLFKKFLLLPGTKRLAEKIRDRRRGCKSSQQFDPGIAFKDAVDLGDLRRIIRIKVLPDYDILYPEKLLFCYAHFRGFPLGFGGGHIYQMHR